jgi:hypothetical protein
LSTTAGLLHHLRLKPLPVPSRTSNQSPHPHPRIHRWKSQSIIPSKMLVHLSLGPAPLNWSLSLWGVLCHARCYPSLTWLPAEFYFPASPAHRTTSLDHLKQYTTVVCDTGDFESQYQLNEHCITCLS